MFTIESTLNGVTVSQTGYAIDFGSVMIDGGASVNVCPTWFESCTVRQLMASYAKGMETAALIEGRSTDHAVRIST